MIPIDEAKESRFANSTVDELRSYMNQAGLPVSPNFRRSDVMRKTLCQHFGLVDGPSPVALPKVSSGSGEKIEPDYNLRPIGKWGGRRHRVRLHRTRDTTEHEGAIPVSVNGKMPPNWWAYGEVIPMPEPDYLRLTSLRRLRAVTEDIDEGGVTTRFEDEPVHHVEYLGVDRDTEHLCGSMQEWYQKKGPAWFRQRTERELLRICQNCDIQTQDKNRNNLKPEDLLPALMTFLYGYPDATETEAAA